MPAKVTNGDPEGQFRLYPKAKIRQGADRVSAPALPLMRRAGPAANSNNNVRGDMPFDEPFGERLQRSSQLAVVLLGHRHCQGRAPQSFATIEARRVSQSTTRLQR